MILRRSLLAALIAFIAGHPAPSDASEPGDAIVVRYRLEGKEVPVASGGWVPTTADLHIALDRGAGPLSRAYRLEVLVLQNGEQVKVEVPGIQEWDKATRKWIHTDISGSDASEGRWIWSGTFRPGDQVTVQWRDSDTGRLVPHPVTLRIVASFGAKLAFATPVSVVFPVSGEPTATASAGFSVRYYRTTNAPFWRVLDRIGFPAVGFAYADVGGEKSVLYALGISALDDQIHLYYGGFRNNTTANNFWMIGFSLKTRDLVAAARRAIR